MDNTRAIYPVTIDPVVVSASKAAETFTGGAAMDQFSNSVAFDSDGSWALVEARQNDTSGSKAGACVQTPAALRHPYTSGGIITGTAGTVGNGLALNPNCDLTNVDLYFGTSPTTLFGSTPVRSGIPLLQAFTTTTVNDVNLALVPSGT